MKSLHAQVTVLVNRYLRRPGFARVFELRAGNPLAGAFLCVEQE